MVMTKSERYPVRCEIDERDCPRCGFCEKRQYLARHTTCRVCVVELSGKSAHSADQLMPALDRSFAKQVPLNIEKRGTYSLLAEGRRYRATQVHMM